MKPIKLTFRDLQCLYQAQTAAIIGSSDAQHAELLLECHIQLLQKFAKMIARCNYTYRLKFSSLEALAFMQIWVGESLPDYASVLILDIIAHLDKASKQPKPIAL